VSDRQRSEDVGHGLEDPRAVLEPTGRRCRSIGDLGNEAGQITAGHDGETPEEIVGQRRANRFHPRREGKDVLPLALTTDEHLDPAALGAPKDPSVVRCGSRRASSCSRATRLAAPGPSRSTKARGGGS